MVLRTRLTQSSLYAGIQLIIAFLIKCVRESDSFKCLFLEEHLATANICCQGSSSSIGKKFNSNIFALGMMTFLKVRKIFNLDETCPRTRTLITNGDKTLVSGGQTLAKDILLVETYIASASHEIRRHLVESLIFSLKVTRNFCHDYFGITYFLVVLIVIEVTPMIFN